MLKKKNAQGLSIEVIIITVVALIVLVVLIALFTGKLGGFSSGVKKSVACENSCKAIGMDKDDVARTDKNTCTAGIAGNRYLPGTYDDVTSGVCCCKTITTTPQSEPAT